MLPKSGIFLSSWNVPPSLQEEIPNLKQRLGNRFSPLTVLLDGDERVPFDLVLKKEWNAAAIIAAVLADRGFGASALLPLELIAVHEGRESRSPMIQAQFLCEY